MARILHQQTRTGRRGGPGLAAAVIAALVAVLPWWVQETGQNEARPVFSEDRSRVDAARQVAWPPSAAQAAPSAGGAAAAGRPASRPFVQAVARGGTPACETSTAHRPGDPVAHTRPLPEGARAAAQRSLEMSMSTHREARTRAAALLWQVRRGLDAGGLAEAREQDAACRLAAADGLTETVQYCDDAAARRQADLLAPLRPQIDQLARLAALSDDPVVHGFAQEACEPVGLSHFDPPANCQLAGAAVWARVAPESAEPWLLLAAHAQARGQHDATSLALARAAAARRIDEGVGALAALASAALPEGLPPQVQAAAMAEVAAHEGGANPGALAAVQQLCTGASLREPGRRAPCDALAALMAQQGRSADTTGAGVQLAEHLGWPAELTSAMVREHQAALQARLRYLAADDALSCEGLQRQRLVATLTAQVGEIESGRRLMTR